MIEPKICFSVPYPLFLVLPPGILAKQVHFRFFKIIIMSPSSCLFFKWNIPSLFIFSSYEEVSHPNDSPLNNWYWPSPNEILKTELSWLCLAKHRCLTFHWASTSRFPVLLQAPCSTVGKQQAIRGRSEFSWSLQASGGKRNQKISK